MTLKTTEIEVRIVVGELPVEGEEGDEATLAVANVGGELLFGRLDAGRTIERFIEEVAGRLDVGKQGASTYYFEEVFERVVQPRALAAALRRVSKEHEEVALSELGSLVYVNRSKVKYRARCGEEFTFSRRDLERVAEEFA